MDPAPELVHQTAGRFRIPVINPGEQAEDRAGRNDIMEMGNHVVRVVQIKVGKIESQRQTGQSPDAEHRQDRKSTRLNSSHGYISYAVFCLKIKHRVFVSDET